MRHSAKISLLRSKRSAYYVECSPLGIETAYNFTITIKNSLFCGRGSNDAVFNGLAWPAPPWTWRAVNIAMSFLPSCRWRLAGKGHRGPNTLYRGFRWPPWWLRVANDWHDSSTGCCSCTLNRGASNSCACTRTGTHWSQIPTELNDYETTQPTVQCCYVLLLANNLARHELECAHVICLAFFPDMRTPSVWQERMRSRI